MTSNVVQLKLSDVEKTLAVVEEIGFDEITILGRKGDVYSLYIGGVESITETIGALEMVKFDLLNSQ